MTRSGKESIMRMVSAAVEFAWSLPENTLRMSHFLHKVGGFVPFGKDIGKGFGWAATEHFNRFPYSLDRRAIGHGINQ